MSDTLHEVEDQFQDRLSAQNGLPTKSEVERAILNLGLRSHCTWKCGTTVVKLHVYFESNEDLNLFRLSTGIKESWRVALICKTTT